MGRATSGVKGMSFREGDELLSMNVVRPGTFVFTATDGGYAKRTAVDEYRVQGRGGLGIKAAKIVEDRGSLVGALVVEETDEILAITLSGGVIRTRVNEIRETGRDTMGVQLINLSKRDAVVGIARNAEAGREAEEVDGDVVVDESADGGLHRRGSPATGWRAVSATTTPWRRAVRRMPSLRAVTREISGRATGQTRERSGTVIVATRAPCSVSAPNIASRWVHTSSASKPGLSRSLTPATTVATSGRRARAGASCSVWIWAARRPRTARLAYWRAGSCRARCSARRSAKPRRPVASSPSPTPSVWLSPRAT